jgi:hypothetical protein
VRSSGEMVIIDGYCALACTIVLGTLPHDKICVASRARLKRPHLNRRRVAFVLSVNSLREPGSSPTAATNRRRR